MLCGNGRYGSGEREQSRCNKKMANHVGSVAGTDWRIGGGGKRGFSPETKASLWRNGVAPAAFHHELNQIVNRLRRDAAALRIVDLIHVKSAAAARDLSFSVEEPTLEGAFTMPTETAVVVAAIVAMFAIYAAALIWADFYTRNYHPPH